MQVSYAAWMARPTGSAAENVEVTTGERGLRKRGGHFSGHDVGRTAPGRRTRSACPGTLCLADGRTGPPPRTPRRQR
jgi:hypothetical protein